MSDTPRTDAVVGTIQINDPHCLGPAQVVSASFARQLERELNARSEADSEAEHLRMQIGYIATQLMLRGDTRTLPEIVEEAAKATSSRDAPEGKG